MSHSKTKTDISIPGFDALSRRFFHDDLEIETDTISKRTFLINCEEVSAGYRRSPVLLLDFLGTMLHCDTDPHDQQDQKDKQDSRKKYALCGVFTKSAVNHYVTQFASLLTFCRICGHHETNIRVKGLPKKITKNSEFYLRCLSCGGKTDLNTAVQKSKRFKTVEWDRIRKCLAQYITLEEESQFRRLSCDQEKDL